MSILSWIAKPLIKEVVKTAMNNFMEKHWTRFLAGLVIVFVGVAWLMGKPGVDVESFLYASAIGVGGNAVRSVGHAVASNKHSQPEVKP